MEAGMLRKFREVMQRPNGIVLVTGPTGSGKTTTLYSALSHLNSIEKNIITLEDPVEYEFPLIRQSQVNPKINFTFAEGLKSILRQDPDIILVGEMRDKETIDMSIRAALTGHMVFSTIHTNNSISTINRLADMGVEPFLIASTVIMIIAQRLVRTICESCKEPVDINRFQFDIPPQLKDFTGTYYHGKGCDKCNHTGCSGRIGVFEVLTVSPILRDMIERNKTTQELTLQITKEGFRTLYDDALEKVKQGLITLEEANKVSMGAY